MAITTDYAISAVPQFKPSNGMNYRYSKFTSTDNVVTIQTLFAAQTSLHWCIFKMLMTTGSTGTLLHLIDGTSELFTVKLIADNSFYADFGSTPLVGTENTLLGLQKTTANSIVILHLWFDAFAVGTA